MRHRIILFLVSTLALSCARSTLNDPHQIVIWHQMRPEEGAVLNWALEKFLKENPSVKVTALYKETEELRSGYQIAAVGGGGPDLVYGPSDQVGPFEVMKIILPLDPLFDQQYLAKFNPKGLVHSNGHLYQIADQIGNHLMLIYNKRLVPTPPLDTDELVRIGEKITHALGQYGLVWNYTEPFFFIPFLTGFGGWVMDSVGNPTLDSPAMIKALEFVKEMRDKYKIIPRECDYNTADALFKEGKAGMIINGPWSVSGYKKAGIDFGITRIPKVVSTGLWPSPMVSPKGYSINVSEPAWKLPLVVKLLEFLLSPEIELEFTKRLDTLPTELEAAASPIVQQNKIVRDSNYQMEVGRPMPIVPELRAIWDAMRPSYQAVLGGTARPQQAATQMQEVAIQKIREMNE